MGQGADKMEDVEKYATRLLDHGPGAKEKGKAILRRMHQAAPGGSPPPHYPLWHPLCRLQSLMTPFSCGMQPMLSPR